MKKSTLSLQLNCLKTSLAALLTDLLLTLFKSIIPGVRRINLDDFNLYILSVRELLESLIGGLATQLEKSYVEHPNFHPPRDLGTALLTAATKYASYLAQNLLQKHNQSEEEKPEK